MIVQVDYIWIPLSFLSDAAEQPAEAGALEMSPGTLDHASFAETEGVSSGKKSDTAFLNKADNVQLQEMHDQLADFEDEISLVESQKSIVPRRHLRMIIDLEDNE